MVNTNSFKAEYAAREFEPSDPDFANVLFDIAYLVKRF
jgi:hypothetical protein